VNAVFMGPFDALLREKLAELDADESPAPLVIDDDPVERLRLDARQAVLHEHHGPMPRSANGAYAPQPEPIVESQSTRHLNIVH